MKTFRIGLWLICALLFAPLLSGAKSIQGQAIFSIHPGIGFYSMQDMNHQIKTQQSGFMGISPSENLNPMGMSLDLGACLEYAFFDYLILGLDMSYLVADSSAKVSSSILSPPQDQYYIISLPAMETGVFVKGVLPITATLHFTLGTGISYLALSGAGERLETRSRLTGLVSESTSVPYSGNSRSIKFMTGLDWFIWEWLSLGLEGGYRLARVDEVTAKIDGNQVVLKNADNSNFTLDYSGPYLHYTFRFYF